MTVKDWITDDKLNYPDNLLSARVVLVAFGAPITVPILTGLDPGVALFTAGAFTPKGVALATPTGVILDRILPNGIADES